jgi:hypothetical protein
MRRVSQGPSHRLARWRLTNGSADFESLAQGKL